MLNGDNGIYSKQIKIATYDMGPRKIIRLSSIMKYQQEVGEEYMCAIGKDFDTLYEKFGVIFVISHAKVKIHRMPKEHEFLKLTTWCTGSNESKFRRCYRFETLSGEVLIESISLLPTVDINSHRPVRPSKVEAFNDFKYNDSITMSITDPKKVVVPKDAQFSGDRKIRYSDLDYNSHVNNSVYADIITDFLLESLKIEDVSEFEIYYRSEMKLGETISISVANTDNNFFISGENNGVGKFAARCELKKLV